MKTKFICLIICTFALFSGCKKDVFVLPDALITVKSNLTDELGILNQKLAEAVVYAISVDMDTAGIRSKLLELVNSSMNFTDVAWVTPGGIMQIIEPAVYYGSQGTDISQQDHVIQAFNTRLPVLSRQFLTVEGFHAAVIIHPVVTNNTVAGGISALFFPELILENVMKPVFEGKDFELWAMEKGGRILYDQDTYEIGRNLFTDSLYTAFPELIAAGRKIDSDDSGTTYYSFYQAGTTVPVRKLTYWNTFELYGTQWKLVWVKPE